MEQEDRDRLIKIETDVSWVREIIKTHLSDHTKIKLLVFSSLVAAVTALLIAVL